MKRTNVICVALAMGLVLCTAVQAAQTDGMTKGDVALGSASALAFTPDGALLIGDTAKARVVAVATGGAEGSSAKEAVNVSDVKAKIAAALGTEASAININDLAVNPLNGVVYVAVSRGSGGETQPVILTVNAQGKIAEFSLKGVMHAAAEIPDAPTADQTARRFNPIELSITDLGYVEGRVVIAGIAKEGFSSLLRAIEYPFDTIIPGTTVEIYHAAHGRLETNAPVRTFVPITIKGVPQIIAAYTCTPLVRIPVGDLKPGAKVQGTTVAELGNRNRPLDIIAYEKGGKAYLLMANSARGVMKISTEEIGERESLSERVSGTAGQPYDTIEDLKNVTQLDRLDDTQAVLLIEQGDAAELKTVPLP